MDTVCTVLILLAGVIIFGLSCWAIDESKRRKARREKAEKEAEPVISVKEKADELRVITEGKETGEENGKGS
jgi:hypothetical protein